MHVTAFRISYESKHLRINLVCEKGALLTFQIFWGLNSNHWLKETGFQFYSMLYAFTAHTVHSGCQQVAN